MDILYLVHRIPYPPDKGDKIRSYRWLVHLAQKHRIHLVTLYDDPADARHIDSLRAHCASVHAFRLKPFVAKVKALAALVGSRPLSLPYFYHAGAERAVRNICRDHAIDAALVYSSSMCQYLDAAGDVPVVMDMVDVDSAKFARYAELGSGIKSRIYSVEARRLARYEEEQTARCDSVILVTEPEADLLRSRVADSRKVVAIGNGTMPPPEEEIPAPRTGSQIVFVGAMDYEPNVDAVIFAAEEVLPLVRMEVPEASFVIVGRDPTPAVMALDALPGVTVTGAVSSIDTYLREAVLSLVPLRIAQGIQNKVLEAMAWQLPVVTNRRIARSLDNHVEGVLCAAETAEEYATECVRLLQDAEVQTTIGRAARAFVIENFSWEPRLLALDQLIEGLVREDSAIR